MENRNITMTQYELVQIYEVLIQKEKDLRKELEEEKKKEFSDEYFITRQKSRIETMENLINKLEEQL